MFNLFGKKTSPGIEGAYMIAFPDGSSGEVTVAATDGAAKLDALAALTVRGVYLSRNLYTLIRGAGRKGPELTFQILQMTSKGCMHLLDTGEYDFAAACSEVMGTPTRYGTFDPARARGANQFKVSVYGISPESKYGEAIRHIDINIPLGSDLRKLAISVPIFAESWLRTYADDSRMAELFKQYFAGILEHYGEDPARVRDKRTIVNAPVEGFRKMSLYVKVMKDLGEF
jgi:hypothetical protein